MVFIKPSIVHGSEDAMLISQMKYHTARQAQANYRETLEKLGGNTSVRKMLPPWKNPKDLPIPFEATSL